MQKRSSFVHYFLVFFALSLLIFLTSQTGILKPISSFSQSLLSPIQSATYGIFYNFTSGSSQIKLLEEENSALSKKLIDQTKLVQDNKALRDQFQTQNPASSSLIPADVIGAPGFIPGISVPETLTLDKGENDGLKTGDAVIYKDNLIGKITKMSAFSSSVTLVTNSSSSFTAKTLKTQSLGVVKGQGGGEIILDNVLLSDTLQKQDIVLTKGDVNQDGSGFPPDLVVGKIISISKNPSDLFQKAEIKSLVDFANLNKVFVQTNLQ